LMKILSMWVVVFGLTSCAVWPAAGGDGKILTGFATVQAVIPPSGSTEAIVFQPRPPVIRPQPFVLPPTTVFAHPVPLVLPPQLSSSAHLFLGFPFGLGYHQRPLSRSR